MKKFATFSGYLLVMISILGWWALAFNPSKNEEKPAPSLTEVKKKPDFYEYLAPFDRNSIQKALSGDFDLMTKLILEWDVDAKIMESEGILGVRRLSRHSYVRSQVVGRHLKNAPSKKDQKKYLPQTYISATFLLALLEPEQIVGLPPGFRKQKNLFSQELYQKIPLDLERVNSESIFQQKPDLAFVANYSQPSTIQALQNQGIELFTLNAFNTIPEIADSIQQIGQVVDRSIEAELMTLFMESALIAIDNRLLAVHDNYIASNNPIRLMFLNYHTQFSVPTARTITGHLLQRLMEHKIVSLSPAPNHFSPWMNPIDQEKIANFNPDVLLIASQPLKDPFSHKKLSSQIHFLDDDIQQSNTQYIVLAYFDLAEAILSPFGGL